MMRRMETTTEILLTKTDLLYDKLVCPSWHFLGRHAKSIVIEKVWFYVRFGKNNKKSNEATIQISVHAYGLLGSVPEERGYIAGWAQLYFAMKIVAYLSCSAGCRHFARTNLFFKATPASLPSPIKTTVLEITSKNELQYQGSSQTLRVGARSDLTRSKIK